MVKMTMTCKKIAKPQKTLIKHKNAPHLHETLSDTHKQAKNVHKVPEHEQRSKRKNMKSTTIT
jgi:hypothetical protein